MNNDWPSKEEDIDIFFKQNLNEAAEESSLHESSWQKISESLDFLGNVPPGASSSAGGASNISQGKSFIASVSTQVKVLIVGGALSGIVAGGYLYFSPAKNSIIPPGVQLPDHTKVQHLLPEKDSIKSDTKPNLPAVTSSNIDASGTPGKNEAIRTESEHPVITDQKNNTDNAETIQNSAPSPDIKQEEVKPMDNLPLEKEKIEIVDKVIDPEAELPAKDYREKMLETAKKKSRPLFTPKKD